MAMGRYGSTFRKWSVQLRVSRFGHGLASHSWMRVRTGSGRSPCLVTAYPNENCMVGPSGFIAHRSSVTINLYAIPVIKMERTYWLVLTYEKIKHDIEAVQVGSLESANLHVLRFEEWIWKHFPSSHIFHKLRLAFPHLPRRCTFEHHSADQEMGTFKRTSHQGECLEPSEQ
jgi:hypothetical protein